MNNASMNPVILFLRVLGFLPPPNNGRTPELPNRRSAAVPDSEESIIQGYHSMLNRFEL